MSNREDHDFAGAIAGGLSTLIAAKLQGRNPTGAELLGGVLGGMTGSSIPDYLEPATSPHHRQFAHSAFFTTALVATAGQGAVTMQANMIVRAAQIEQTDPVGAFLLRMMAGFAPATVAGYASHIALDATTPMGIPLLGK
jgi:membrane-bound metal-dependent hydrolase YbcI (DUF457 family)